MTTTALLILQEQLTNKIIHGFMVDHHPDAALFSLTPIWNDWKACTLRIISLRYNSKAKGYVLAVKCLERPNQVNDSNELSLRLEDTIRFV